MAKQLTTFLAIPSLSTERRALADHLLDLCAASKKFMLPDGGFLLMDTELRGLSADVPLRLPYPFVALEFHQGQSRQNTERMIIFARERSDENTIVITTSFFNSANGTWMAIAPCIVPMTNYFGKGEPGAQGKDGLRFFHSLTNADAQGIEQLYNESTSVVLSFLNALQCSNIHIVRSEPKKLGKKVKAALPFDTYHVLTIDVGRSSGAGLGLTGCSHRSPREHLRRGHIRRLEDGRRIWVNATVVAAGRNAGIVTKDYAMRAAPESRRSKAVC